MKNKDININKDTMITISDAINNFSKIAQMAETNGKIIIFENDKPKFLLIDMESNSYFELSDDEKIDIAAARILKRFRPAFEELAKNE